MPTYFLYARKSTESEDRQVQSIESQVKELTEYAQKNNLTIEKVFTESKSAKQPGRPVFNQMMKEIRKRKEPVGILCWKPDRLARNMMDGAIVIWELEKEALLEILTPNRPYRNNSNDKFMLQLEFGMAKKFVDDLSENVKRGLRAKVEKGWQPGVAPLGYLNNKTGEKGQKTISKDPERFHLIKRIWKLMLTGLYMPPKILDLANNRWGLRTRQMVRQGGKPLSRSTIYVILTNPFYCGMVQYKGNLYPGKHEPMVSVEEFEQVQRMLGKRGHPRVKSYSFAYRGLLKCGECGAMITAEQKRKLLKATGSVKLYHYYHCTKRKDPTCPQGSMEEKELEAQIEKYLRRIEIPDFLYDWFIKYLDTLKIKERNENQEYIEKQKKALEKCQKELENLLRLRISADNDGSTLISDQEFSEQRNRLLMEKARLEQSMHQTIQKEGESHRLTRQTFEFARYCRFWFKTGNREQKKAIVAALGSNHELYNKKLLIELKKPLSVLERGLQAMGAESSMFEPLKFGSISRQTALVTGGLSANLRLVDDVRTAIKESKEKIEYPDFTKMALQPV
jgi:DNA invertase Pin-like site-specific DNA recombinase/predicted metal-binding protein